MTLSPHGIYENVTIVETLVRNYRPRDPFCIQWIDQPEKFRYYFTLRSDLDPIKKISYQNQTSINSKLPLPSYENAVLDLFKEKALPISVFKDHLKRNLNITDKKVNTITHFMTSPDNRKLKTYDIRKRGVHQKFIGMPDQIDKIIHENG
jgi:hypothetical protein